MTVGLASTAADKRIGEVGVGVATATEPLCLLPDSTAPPLALLGTEPVAGEGYDATLSRSLAPATTQDHDDNLEEVDLSRQRSPPMTVGDFVEDTVAPAGSGGSSPAPTPQASSATTLPAAPLLLAAPSMAGVGEGASEEQAIPPTTPTATYTEEVIIPVDTTTLAVGELPPTGTTAPIKVLRRSNRNAATADVHTLHMVERMTAKKNLEFLGNSFTSFPDSKVLANLGRIGINLGTSAVVSIKNLEVDRLVLCANGKKGSTKSTLSNLESDDERESQIDVILSHNCGNLNENLLEEESDQIIDLSPLRRKKKYNNAKNIMKGKLPKKPKTPSKIIIK